MYLEYFEHLNLGLADLEIEEFARFLGKHLPDDLMTLYRETDGGTLNSQYNRVIHGGQHIIDVSLVFHLRQMRGIMEMYREVEATQSLEFKLDYKTDSLLPLMSQGHSFVCIGYDGNYSGKVYWTDYTDGLYFDGFPLIHLANSLPEFFESLQPYSY